MQFTATSDYMKAMLFRASYDDEKVEADWKILLSSDVDLRDRWIAAKRTELLLQITRYCELICKYKD